MSGFLKQRIADLRPRIFLQEFLLFAAVQGLALVAASRIRGNLLSSSPFPVSEPIRPAEFLVWFIIAMTIMLIVLRLRSAERFIIRIMWALALFGGIVVFFATTVTKNAAMLVALVLSIIYWKAPTVLLHNVILVMALPGIGAVIGGQLTPFRVIALLLFMSAYDIYAVYGTGHMITMAKRFIASGVIPGIIVGEVEPDTPIAEVTPSANLSILGTGDVVLPSILVASAWFYGGWTWGLITAVASSLGLLATHLLFYSQKQRHPMAALPPIAIATILGFYFSYAFL